MNTFVDTYTERAPTPFLEAPRTRRRPGIVIGTARPSRRVALAVQFSASGFEVWGAASGMEVLDTYLEHTGAVDVLLLDADLPDLPAPAFHRRLHAHFPGLPCFFLAEEPLSQLVTQAQLLGAEVFIWPLALRRLVDCVRATLLVEE